MSLAGSKGGSYPNMIDLAGFDIPVVNGWQSVGQKATSGAQLYRNLLYLAQPVQVEVGIGNTCGLQCQHCFLGYEAGQMDDDLISMPRLLETFSEFVEQLGTRIVCVTDRDALTPNRSIPFFEHLLALRNRYPDLKFGGVTNGLAIDKYADDLARIKLDYLDISLDGLREEHDAMRGVGMFDRTVKNLRIALQRQVAERVIVATTLTRFNDHSIIKLIRSLILEEGVQWFDIGPLMAVKMQEHQLRESDTVNFLETLFKELSGLHVDRPVTIFLEICSYCAAFIPALVDSGWLIPERIRQDCYGHLYQEICVNEGIKIVLRPELIPDYWRHTLRITADGYVVGGCEPLTQKDYQRMSIGNIKEESAKTLFDKALALGSPFHKMMLAYDFSECRSKACFLHCLGGDALLSKAVYDNYNIKDPNCVWDEYQYHSILKEVAHVS